MSSGGGQNGLDAEAAVRVARFRRGESRPIPTCRHRDHPLAGEACVDAQCEIKGLCANGPPLESGPSMLPPADVVSGELERRVRGHRYAAGSLRCRQIDPADPKDISTDGPNLKQCQPNRPTRATPAWSRGSRCGLTPGRTRTRSSVNSRLSRGLATLEEQPDRARGYLIDRFDPALAPTDLGTPGSSTWSTSPFRT